MRKSVRRLGVAFALLPLALPAMADTISIDFTPITSNSGLQNTVAAQFDLEISLVPGTDYAVLPDGYNWVSFKFSNTGSIASNITELYWTWDAPDVLDSTAPLPGGFYYFDDETWTLDPTLGGSGPQGVNPSNLPSGSNIGFVADAGADGGNTAGISTGESAIFFMGTVANASWDDLSGALYDGLIHFGLHVRSINGGTSDSFASITPIPPTDPEDPDPPVVPVPGAAGLGLLGMAIVAKLRKKGAKTA